MSAFHFEVQPALLLGKPTRRLDHLLSELTHETRSFLQQNIERGNVLLNGTPALKAGQRVRAGDKIEGQWNVPVAEAVVPVARDLHIIYEDADLLVLNKPQDLVVHPAPSHKGETLVHYLLAHFQDPKALGESDRPGIVHRLDKGTSGLLLVAKNRYAQERLAAQFKNRQVHKEYEAIVFGKMAGKGRFESQIGRDTVHRLKMSSRTRSGRAAVTLWKEERSFAHFTLVKLQPLTGRTHQLRVHLCENHHPIVGDPLYGRGLTDARRKQIDLTIAQTIDHTQATFLHAARLDFTHPMTQQPLRFEAPRPASFDQFLKLLEERDV